MRKQRRRLLYFTSCILGVAIVALGAIFGAPFLFSGHRNGAYASGTQSLAMKMSKSLNPMMPMKGKAVRVPSAAQQQAAIGCLNAQTPPLCYSPQQLRTAYGVPSTVNNQNAGQGRIISIIDEFQDPNLQAEVQTFDNLFNLPAASINTTLLNAAGTPIQAAQFNPNDPNAIGFAGEIALDVEWAHAIAPGATIDLFLGQPNNQPNETLQDQSTALLNTTKFAVQHSLGSVISQSFGVSESCAGTAFIQQEHAIFQQARAQKQTVFASAGDSGAAAVQCQNGQPVALAQGVNYPASDPLVTAVGGTTLTTQANGTFVSETTWNNATANGVANGGNQTAASTGGGVSTVFAQPAYQNNIAPAGMRNGTDISLDADPNTGVALVTSTMMGGQMMLMPVGGTSVGSPVAAAMTAVFDQATGNMRLGFLNSAFYRISQNAAAYTQTFHDVQSGNNTVTITVQNGNNAPKAQVVQGFNAKTGWDNPTGVGTPQAANLMKQLPNFIQTGDGANL